MNREVVYDPNTNKYYNVEQGKTPDPKNDTQFNNHFDACYNNNNINYPTDGVREGITRYSKG